jgi:NADPH:quinone reductase-like Zn-dependent oxidoreductase
VILDIGGNRSLRHLRRALTPGGTLVLVGGEAGGRWTGGMGRVLRAMLLSRFVGQRLRGFLNSENAADLRAVAGLADSGQVTPVIDRTYALADTVAAIQYMEAGRTRGKVVITV